MLPLFRNQSATSFAWKGRSSSSRSRLSNSVIPSAVLGFLILFNPSRNVLVETTRIRNLVHFRFQLPKNNLSLFRTGVPMSAWVWRGSV